MMRHGLSTYNVENRFTGCLDVPLSEVGMEEAKDAAIKLKEYRVDIAYTSKLKRAIDTLQIILSANNYHIPVIKTEALNERNYGDLQGLNKTDTVKQYGEAQVLLWRRSYNIAPPGGESLKDTAARVIPFLHSVIFTAIGRGLNVLIVAHGNSLRAIAKELDAINDEDIANLNIDTCKIYLYRFDENLKITGRKVL